MGLVVGSWISRASPPDSFSRETPLRPGHRAAHARVLGSDTKSSALVCPAQTLLTSANEEEMIVRCLDSGGSTDKHYATVPFVEAQVVRRLGNRWTNLSARKGAARAAPSYRLF